MSFFPSKSRTGRQSSPDEGVVERIFARYAKLALLHPWALTLLALVLLLGSLPFAVKLYTDLRTDLRELLPRNAPAAVALTTLEKRVGGTGYLSVVISTDDPKAGERFDDALSAALENKLVPSLAREVRSRTDEDRAYLDAHGALYASLPDLTDLDLGIKEDINKAKVKALDQDLDAEATARDPRVERVIAKLKGKATEQDHFFDGYLADQAGRTFVVVVMPKDVSTSLDSNLRLYHAVAAEVEALRPSSFDPSIRVGYSGEVRELIEAQEHLVHDLELSSFLVLAAVGAAIVVFYRRFRALPIIVGPLLVGTSLTFALGRIAIGYLNPNTAFLGSIILGNGINAGIILLARYFEERRAGAKVDQALPVASIRTWRATLVASGAAAASYACLGVTGFRGFNQFAFLGGVGMITVWLATYAFMPPLLVLFERWKPLTNAALRSAAPGGGPFGRLSQVLTRFAAPIGVACLGLLVLAAGSAARFTRDPIEYDFTKLGSRQGAVDGTTYWGKRVDEVMQSYMSPTVVLTESAEGADAVGRAVRAEKDAEGEQSPIASVATLADVLPTDQEEKLAVLRDITDQLTDRVVRDLPEGDRADVEKLRKTTELRTVAIGDLPAHVRRLFLEKDGALGRLVLVYPRLDVGASHGRRQLDFARSIRATAERADPHAQVAGSIVLSADIIESITHDGLLASCLSFLGVSFLTALIIGSARNSAFVIGSLCTGTLLLVGTLGFWGIKLNFVNFAVLPITFGIGIDYAVNFYQRYREAGRGRAAQALAGSGGAVALCSLTTILGYSALLVADNRAIFSFGLTAVIGEVACLSTALIALPVLLMLRDRKGRWTTFSLGDLSAHPPARSLK
jgi:predicted RND superfamily exporter protein